MPDFIAREIVKEFETLTGSLRILDGVNVELERGQNLAVVGPSGSGKSTFLHIAGSLDAPTGGSVILQNQNPANLNPKELAHFRNRHVGFVFQRHHLLPQLSALENVLIPVLAEGEVDEATTELARELLEQVGLGDRADHRPGQLSGGECQRVAVARSLVRKPLLMLADEPTGSLDQKNAHVIGELLLRMQEQHNTILLCVTHSEALAEMFQAKVTLSDGKFE
ncbi:ABC transporter ATP-binding protein [bacterium]|nr:ABC transporter ATP-binding protein [bacterium]